MTREFDPRIIELIGSIDDSSITNVTRLKKERQDLLVSCDSGRKHLIRFEKKHISLIHQKWAYEKMRSGGIPCPEIEAFFEPEIAGIIDVEETGVGWPMWDFTNWERWGLYYGDAWVREPVLEAYGEIDMAMYRFAVMTRMAQHSEIFTGTIRKQVTRAVDARDIMAFDLDKLYQ